ncbi:cyclic AMP response element-binding protein B isoform X1 [Lutzomyia longipalpis]|uniref:Putative camp response element binding protein n=1 Tax=Lutzomyia longipalpis TaxID=7200 RepID=A0A7G3AAZ0_LUTLO|nr:cyclic AMP response element-binding protein B isoform X1 [Lutzomyia longipalpis]XP_055680508.1 cyclic AMP response element-binding protein B isoform X1 [Lutzomyia longipalpis]XP_055680509.1 cyclic AMP response element-binding protein B isoform X1 [Lutzomyia longipalpis]
MDSMVEENGNSSIDPLSDQTSPSETNSGSAVLTTAANIVQFIPTQAVQVSQSVIQANQSSVIQTATNLQPMTLAKGVLYVNKNNSVIHTAPAGLQVKIKPEPNTTPTQVQVNDTNSEDDSITDDESPKRRRDLLTRRPSYHRILKEISGPDIAVLPTTTLQITNVQGGDPTGSLHTISTPGGGGTIVQYTQGQDGQFFVPVLGGPVLAEDQSRKREIRLQKNREAARECRRKKKEYIKCLENRVAVLENQNKALIEELKTLKELYCQSKND